METQIELPAQGELLRDAMLGQTPTAAIWLLPTLFFSTWLSEWPVNGALYGMHEARPDPMLASHDRPAGTAEARYAIAEYIEVFYNRQRLLQALTIGVQKSSNGRRLVVKILCLFFPATTNQTPIIFVSGCYT